MQAAAIPHPLTRRQYLQQATADLWQEYADTLDRNEPSDRECVAEAAKMRTNAGWWTSVTEYVRDGGVLRAQWLNTLADDPKFYRDLQRIDPTASPIPPHYVIPSCR